MTILAAWRPQGLAELLHVIGQFCGLSSSCAADIDQPFCVLGQGFTADGELLTAMRELADEAGFDD